MADEVEKMLFLLYDKYHGYPGVGAQYVDLALKFRALEFLAALSNRNKTFIGSANMSGFVLGNRVIVIVADVKSQHSLAAHMSHNSDHYRTPGNTRHGNTYQFYIWSVGLKNYEWFKVRTHIFNNKGGKKEWLGIYPRLRNL